MLERKHVEAIEKATLDVGTEDMARRGFTPAFGRLTAAVDAALAACDESPCVWTVKPSGRDFIPGCAPETSSAEAGWRHVWSAGFFRNMTYCPHCGRKIAPLPAAPEGKPE